MFPPRGIAALLIASVSFGSSALFIRFAAEASVISLTFFRLSVAGLVMILYALTRRDLKFLKKRNLLLLVVSGTLLSLHFATFILAVRETTIANATFLVNTSPIMLAVLSPLVLRERTTSLEGIAVIIATLGILLVSHAGNGFQGFRLADLSALLAAFFMTLYSLIGRHLRTKGISTASYTAYVYSVAAVISLILTQVLNASLVRAYSVNNIAAILGLAIVPTLLGHSLYNYSLSSVKAVTANLFPLLEPIIASLFAVSLFGEIPALTQIAGYSLILTAVAVVVTHLE